jgi:hypothetical protein
VTLERVKPEVQRVNLGCVRMWREDLDELVRLVGKLPDVKVRIEANENTATDLAADLPQLGPRLAYFTVTGLRASQDSAELEVVRVHLANSGSYVEAADPDLDAKGLFREVEALAKKRRRIPAKLTSYFDLWVATPAAATTPPASAADPGRRASSWSGLSLLLFIVAAVVGIAVGISAVQHLMHPHHHTDTSWPTSIWVAAPALVVAAITGIGWLRARTVLHTVTHATAPTWWERNRTAIVINVITNGVFLWLGWLIAH